MEQGDGLARYIGLLKITGRGLRDVRTDRSGQDLIEYALMAAAIAVVVAGILPPQLMPSISTIFQKVSSTIAGS